MDIIVTHRNADFDALASLMAASKLYPGATKVVAGGLPTIVRRFLALHLDHFELTPVKDVDIDRVKRMIVVDVRRRSRLRDFEALLQRAETGSPPLEVHVYDHHGPAPDDLAARQVCVEPVGATATLMVEQLRRHRIELSPVEASLLALGIHADTGSLTYDSTTARDARAVAFLLSRGASRTVLRYFLHSPLSRRQWSILVDLLTHTRHMEVGGAKIGLSIVPLERVLPDLSEIVGAALSHEGSDALFALFPRGATVTVIARSRLQAVDVGSVLHRLGGGGHHGAAAATLKNTSATAARALLLRALADSPPRPYLIRQCMSTPVVTVSPGQTLEEVSGLLERRKISGAPVLEEGALVGMISKRDIRSARAAGRMRHPVSSCMSRRVHTIDPDQSLARAAERMAEEHIGRLPVVQDARLVGIITRNDVLHQVYGPSPGSTGRGRVG